MDNLVFIKKYLQTSIAVKTTIVEDISLMEKIGQVANLIAERFSHNSKVLIAGNGGSAADAQHIAAEFVSRFLFDRPGLPAVALTTDTSIITAIGNDFGFETLFSRQIEAHGNSGDVFIGISTSGNSKNIINAIEAAKKKNMTTIVLCGDGGGLKEMGDFVLSIPSSVTPIIQESHICVGHIICAIVEESLYGPK